MTSTTATGAVAAFAVLAAVAATPAAADCVTGAPVGLFKGAAGPPGPDQVQITLNLVCSGGRYIGQFFTSSGDFDTMEAKGSEGRASLTFNTGAALGKADLALTGDTLAGSFDLEGDHGALSLVRAGPPVGPDAMTPTLKLTAAQWREDLKVFAAELPKRHANAFATLPRSKFDAEVASLDRRLDHMTGDEAFVGLEQIANSLGDGHTYVRFPPNQHELPIEINRFGDDYRITAVGPGLDLALGARIVTIGNVPIAEAWRRALTLTPQGELMELREGRALFDLAKGLLLHGLDITSDRTHARFGLQDEHGRRFSIDVHARAPGASVPMRQVAASNALWKQDPDKPFWCRELVAESTVYCAFHAYPDLRAHAAEMFALIDRAHPKKLVIDMRDNGGGDYTEGYRWLISPLKSRLDLNVKGRLYVLIGALTFSAAMNNAAQFQDDTNATLVGQTIGERPNSYQEPRQFRLPNSHLVVRASTLYYAFRKHGENAVRPDKQIVPTWEDVKAGRDPVLAWVLAQPAS